MIRFGKHRYKEELIQFVISINNEGDINEYY